MFGWLVEPLLIYLVLAFPSGRLTTASGAASWSRASVLLVALFYLPTALFVDPTRHRLRGAAASAGCPDNAFMLAGSEPGFVGNVIVPFRETVTLILFAGMIAIVAARIRRGTH